MILVRHKRRGKAHTAFITVPQLRQLTTNWSLRINDQMQMWSNLQQSSVIEMTSMCVIISSSYLGSILTSNMLHRSWENGSFVWVKRSRWKLNLFLLSLVLQALTFLVSGFLSEKKITNVCEPKDPLQLWCFQRFWHIGDIFRKLSSKKHFWVFF